MRDHHMIKLRDGQCRILPAHDETDSVQLTLESGPCTYRLYLNPAVFPEDLVSLVHLHRALGVAIDTYQPGITSPLPDDSPDLVDALKVLHEADRLWQVEDDRVAAYEARKAAKKAAKVQEVAND